MEVSLLTCQQHPGQHPSCYLLWRQALALSRDLKQTDKQKVCGQFLPARENQATERKVSHGRAPTP